MKQKRQLSVYERNQLLKHGFTSEDLLSQGELPVEYLTKTVKFKQLDLKINHNVLIPRVETEELVDQICQFCDQLIKEKSIINYLEVGTGSGAISLALYNYLQGQKLALIGQFIASDYSSLALDVARENFQKTFGEKILSKVKLICSDLLSELEQQPTSRNNSLKFNVITANLPYIPSSTWKDLPASVQDFEPKLALVGGETGFELISRLLEQIQSKQLLAPNGKIFLEVYETHQLAFIQKHFPQLLRVYKIDMKKDQFDRPRFLILEKQSKA